MARHIVIWCLEDDVEAVISAPERHGDVVGRVVVDRHITGQYAGSAEIYISKEEDDGS